MKKSLLAVVAFAALALSSFAQAAEPAAREKVPIAQAAAAVQRAKAPVSLQVNALLTCSHAAAPHAAQAAALARVCRGEPRYGHMLLTAGIQSSKPAGFDMRMPPSISRPARYLT